MNRMCLIAMAAALVAGCGEAQQQPAAAAATPAAELAVSKAVPKGWMEDFEAAKKLAAKEKRRILLAVSGSDWCYWCKKLDAEVYGKKEFLDLIAKDYVPVLVDCARDPAILSPLARKQNRELARRFGVDGFPCAILLDSNGKEIGRIGGYVAGGPSAYRAKMDEAAK